MDMTPLLDVALGLFFTIFGPIVISVAISQMRNNRERYQNDYDSWKLSGFLLMTIIASIAAVASGWVYLLGRESRFLLQTIVSMFGAFVGVFSILRIRNRPPLRVSLSHLNDYGLAVASGAMGLSGILMLVTFPFATTGGAMLELRNFITTIGVIAGFSTLGILLFSVWVADPVSS